MHLATMACVYAAYTVCVTIFSTGSKLWLVSNVTELQALTQADSAVKDFAGSWTLL